MNHLSSVMAAKTGIHAVDTVVRIDRQADKIDRQTEKIWRKILAIISLSPMSSDMQRQITLLLREIQSVAMAGVADALRDAVQRSRLRTAATLADKVPIEYLSLAMASEKNNAIARTRIAEGRRATPAERRRIEAQLLPDEDEETVDRIVYSPSGQTTWQQRMAQQTSLASPESVAQDVTMGMLRGETPGQLARRMAPTVQNVRTTARRVARTESTRCSTEANLEIYENLGDIIIGYQINATMDWRVRPHHAARNGTIYYRNPRPGQESMLRMPRPPIEEDGTVAHNCRCNLSPVFQPAEHIENDPALRALFTDRQGDIIPDPATYEEWFAQAPPSERRWAVGARRLRAAQDRLEPGEQLTWASVIDPRTGQLLNHDTIANETSRRRRARIAAVDEIVAERANLAQQVATFGYIPPEQPPPDAIVIGPMPPMAPPGMPPVSVQPTSYPRADHRIPAPPAKTPPPATPTLPEPKAKMWRAPKIRMAQKFVQKSKPKPQPKKIAKKKPGKTIKKKPIKKRKK